MPAYNIALLGNGTVAHALQALLSSRRDALHRELGIGYTITGVASRRTGWRANPGGIDPATPDGLACGDVHEWLAASRADVVFEAIALDAHTGQPALDYVRAALEHGAHVISANKGPVVHGYRALTALAQSRERHYRFEAAVMDGALVSLVRECPRWRAARRTWRLHLDGDDRARGHRGGPSPTRHRARNSLASLKPT
jgi:homoserine dehydrogenase